VKLTSTDKWQGQENITDKYMHQSINQSLISHRCHQSCLAQC